MRSEVPRLLSTLVVGDDPYLLAQLSTALARPRAYLPLLDGPRLTRPDRDHEIIRRTNSLKQFKFTRVILAGLPDSTCELLEDHWPTEIARRVSSLSDIKGTAEAANRKAMLAWGKGSIGIGLLTALRSKQSISFDGEITPITSIALNEKHLVICEEGDDLVQVLAANYAFSIGAGMALIPEYPDDEADALLESLYTVHEQPGAGGIKAALQDLRGRLRSSAGGLKIDPYGSLTFITSKLPWGFAFPERASTHLFRTDLGLRLVAAVFSEQSNSPGIRSVVAIDPGGVDSKEVDPILQRFTENGAICKALRSRGASVTNVSHTIRLFPYDFLVIASHCGDISGYRWTYEFTDSESIARRLVVDLAVGFEPIRGRDDVKVTQFVRFVSLDGVDWNDRVAKRRLYIGSAIKDYLKGVQNDSLEPVHRETVPRVHSSMALRMADGPLLLLPEAIASRSSPIVFNNGCGSWHRLAGDFMFGGARCYLGALFSVLDGEVKAVLDRIFGKYYGHDLAFALWRSQNEVYADDLRRPYIMSGCHFQTVATRNGRPGRSLKFVIDELTTAHVDWRRELKRVMAVRDSTERTIAEYVRFIGAELNEFRAFALRRRRNDYYHRRIN